MMEIIEDLPAGIAGIASKGKITEKDYTELLIPYIDKQIAEHGKIKMLFELADLDGVELAAMWQDTRFGIKHWNDFTHMALVSDVEWINNMTAFFAWMIPAEVKVFPVAEIDKAREWLVTSKAEDKAA